MSTINEAPYIDRWLHARLTGDTGAGGLFGTPPVVSGVWPDLIPEGESLPAIRYSMLAPGVDTMVVDGHRILTNPLYLVAVVHETRSYWGLAAAANRIDTLLHRGVGLFPPITVIECIREEIYRLAEDEGDEHFRHLGGLYRLRVQEEA